MDDLTCDLCEKLPADSSCSLPYPPPTRGMRVVFLCWKCEAKIGNVSRETAEVILNDVLWNGNSLNLAIMFATGQGPHLSTDDTFFRGWQDSGGGQFANSGSFVQNGYLDVAKAAGVSTQGKVYMHGLAEYPGDPRAWVSTRGEMVSILKEKGWGCERLGVKARTDVAPAEIPTLAPDLVQEMVERRIVQEGIDDRELTPKKVEQLKEEAVERHGRTKPNPFAKLPEITQPLPRPKRAKKVK